MRAFFIAKQNKIGDFQPVVLLLTGDDYTSLTLIVLDKNGVPLSGFNLAGGMDGPTGESPMIYEAKSYSLLNKDQIISTMIINSDFPDN